MVGVAGACLLACLLSLAPAAPAPAAGSSLLSTESLPALHVQVGGLLNVEAGPLPAKVEVPGVATVETPQLPRVEAPSQPVETPAPVETPTTPTVSTPVPVTTSPVTSGSPSAPSQPSSQGSAHTASSSGDGGSTGSASPAHPGSSGTVTSTGKGAGAGSHAGVRRAANRHAARAQRATAGAASPASASPALAPAAATSTAASTRPAASRSHVRHRHVANDPLNAIGRQIPFPVPVPDWSKPIILALLLLAIGFAVRARLATMRARRLEAQKVTMLSDIDEMQKALVPAVPERLGGLAVSVAYRPADGPAAGGDFYDLFPLEGGKVAIVVGDVVGHGRDAVAQAAVTRYTLRAYLQAGLEPRAALALAGSVLSTAGEKRFATVVAAIHDGASGRLTYACAGHPPPIALGFEVPEPVTVCCSAPICCDLPTGRRQTTISLPQSGGLCFFSDGLPEARTQEGLLGRERLGELLGELGPAVTAPELIERVRGEAPTTLDDMVACLVSSTVRGPVGTGCIEELEADPEMLEGPRARRFLHACGLDPRRIDASLAQAQELAGREGRALIVVERSCAGTATVLVRPCASPPAGATVAEAASAAEPALALQSAP